MEVCNPSENKDGAPFSNFWNYCSVFGYLLSDWHSQPDISFAVHQVVRFSHEPKQSHAVAVKSIVWYLKGTRDRVLVLCPKDDWKIDCCVDADFYRLWGSGDLEDPVVAKS